jgi:hypothetical protein
VKRRIVFSLLAALAVSVTPALAAEAQFSDKICPTATQPIRDFNALTADKNTPVDAVIAAATHIIDLYKQCGGELQSSSTSAGNQYASVSTTNGPEGLHYAQVHEAQYYTLIGRIQRIIGNPNSARESLQKALDLTKEVLEWKSPRQTVFRSNNVGVGSGSVSGSQTDNSVYRDFATAVRNDALAEMAKLPKDATPLK